MLIENIEILNHLRKIFDVSLETQNTNVRKMLERLFPFSEKLSNFAKKVRK